MSWLAATKLAKCYNGAVRLEVTGDFCVLWTL